MILPPRRQHITTLVIGIVTFLVIVSAVHFSTPLSRALFWVPGRLSYAIGRFILQSPGSHGLGYFNPGLVLILFYLEATLLAAAAAWICARWLSASRQDAPTHH